MVYRGNHSNVDHVFISCLESRFRGAWDTVAGGLVYKAKDSLGKDFMDSKIFELDENGLVLFVMDTAPMHNK